MSDLAEKVKRIRERYENTERLIAAAKARGERPKATSLHTDRGTLLDAFERLERERDEARGYLVRVLEIAAPQIKPFDELKFVCTQVDSVIAHLRAELAEGVRIQQEKNAQWERDLNENARLEAQLAAVTTERDARIAFKDQANAGLQARIEGEERARGYLVRVLEVAAPGIKPMRKLMEVCTQVDNVIAGLTTERRTPGTVEVCPACKLGTDALGSSWCQCEEGNCPVHKANGWT